ncbi:MAG: winged helix-turn-helix transcriptional regulator [Proteobacteria bacterium]|nr:winged helix-turn-helix transcriptional regulator [Pseudomonadota bacterium]
MNDRTGNGISAPSDPPLTLETFLPWRLSMCAQLVSLALAKVHADRHQLGPPEWRVLVILAQFGNMTAKAVGARAQMHKTKVSRAVAVLEKRKLVTRRSNSADLREAFLSLTPAGRCAYDELAPGALEFADRLIAAIDPADRDALLRILERLSQRSVEIAADIANGSPAR